jgi:hypothetical protein
LQTPYELRPGQRSTRCHHQFAPVIVEQRARSAARHDCCYHGTCPARKRPHDNSKPFAASRPTLADLDALPPGVVGEIIEGVLYTMTKPRMRHQWTANGIGGDLRGPLGLGRGGPGGWWIVAEPGIEMPNTPEISPDVAG